MFFECQVEIWTQRNQDKWLSMCAVSVSGSTRVSPKVRATCLVWWLEVGKASESGDLQILCLGQQTPASWAGLWQLIYMGEWGSLYSESLPWEGAAFHE